MYVCIDGCVSECVCKSASVRVPACKCACVRVKRRKGACLGKACLPVPASSAKAKQRCNRRSPFVSWGGLSPCGPLACLSLWVCVRRVCVATCTGPVLSHVVLIHTSADGRNFDRVVRLHWPSYWCQCVSTEVQEVGCLSTVLRQSCQRRVAEAVSGDLIVRNFDNIASKERKEKMHRT